MSRTVVLYWPVPVVRRAADSRRRVGLFAARLVPVPRPRVQRETSVRHHWSRGAADGTVWGMTIKPGNPTPAPRLSTDPGPGGRAVEMRFTSTPRGARLARRMAAVRLDVWGLPYGSEAHGDIVLIVAELTATAVRHGHVPGRDFHFRLHVDAGGATARVEVTDTRAERRPRRPDERPDGPEVEEAGWGLLLVGSGWRPPWTTATRCSTASRRSAGTGGTSPSSPGLPSTRTGRSPAGSCWWIGGRRRCGGSVGSPTVPRTSIGAIRSR